MSSSDLFTADYPHGTPTGYDSGCRGGACPGADMWGLTCRRAKELSRGDYRYQKLAKAGLTPAEIADELGLIPTGANTKPVTKRAPKPKAADEAADRAAGETIDVGPVIILTEPDEQPEPVEQPATVTPTPKQVRTWAIEKGYDVKLRGTLPQHIIDHYWETHDLTPAQPVTTEPEQDTISAQVDTEAPETVTIVPKPDGPRPEWGYVNLTNDLAAAQTERDALTEELEEAQSELTHARTTAARLRDDTINLTNDLADTRGELTRARSLAARLEEELARSEQTRETDRETHAASLDAADTVIRRILLELGATPSDDPVIVAHNLYANYLALAALAAAAPADQDERIRAWELVASHPAFASCYDEEAPLVTSILNRLERLNDSVHELQTKNIELAVALAEANNARWTMITAYEQATAAQVIAQRSLELALHKWAAERERGDHLAEAVAAHQWLEEQRRHELHNRLTAARTAISVVTADVATTPEPEPSLAQRIRNGWARTR